MPKKKTRHTQKGTTLEILGRTRTNEKLLAKKVRTWSLSVLSSLGRGLLRHGCANRPDGCFFKLRVVLVGGCPHEKRPLLRVYIGATFKTPRRGGVKVTTSPRIHDTEPYGLRSQALLNPPKRKNRRTCM